MEVVWPLFVAGSIGLLVAFQLVARAIAPDRRGTSQPGLTRCLLSPGIWLLITGANMIYILSLFWGYHPDLPADWVMAMLGCATALVLGFGLIRWTRAAHAGGPPTWEYARIPGGSWRIIHLFAYQ